VVNYYFVRARSCVGQVNFPLLVVGCGLLADAIGAEAARRGLVFSSDWTAEPIDEFEYRRLMS
jgi:hypothetical protein